jgi:hypothetical protein
MSPKHSRPARRPREESDRRPGRALGRVPRGRWLSGRTLGRVRSARAGRATQPLTTVRQPTGSRQAPAIAMQQRVRSCRAWSRGQGDSLRRLDRELVVDEAAAMSEGAGGATDAPEVTLFDLAEFGEEANEEPVNSEGVFAQLIRSRESEAPGSPLRLRRVRLNAHARVRKRHCVPG